MIFDSFKKVLKYETDMQLFINFFFNLRITVCLNASETIPRCILSFILKRTLS